MIDLSPLARRLAGTPWLNGRKACRRNSMPSWKKVMATWTAGVVRCTRYRPCSRAKSTW